VNVSPAVRTAVAGWLATMLASLTIFPLVQGQGWYLALAFLAALVSGAGLVVRRFTASGVVVVGVQLVVWLVALCAIFVPDVATFGLLPGPGAVAAGQELFTQGITMMHRAAPPVPDTPGIVFVTTGGLSLVALLVDVIAVTLRRPAVAGLPLLAVYCVPAAVLQDGLDWSLFLFAAVGFLVLVAADSFDRVQAWGRVLSGAGGASRWGTGLDGARGIAAASLAAAIVVPFLLPGLGERSLTASGPGNGPGKGSLSVVNPLLDLRKNLTSPSDQAVITYTTTEASPQPLRLVVDDVFTGEGWEPSRSEVPRTQTPDSGPGLAPGLREGVPIEVEHSTIKVGPLGQNFLPLPYPWRSVENLPGHWYYEANTLNVVGDKVTAQNLQYTVEHYLVEPTPQELAQAPAPPASIGNDLSLPSSTRAAITRTAREHAGAGNKYEQAKNLRDWLRTFTYTTQAPGDGTKDSGQDAIVEFLKAKAGYCVHFASAMAVMARALGIPARVAVGFLPGTHNSHGSWTITMRDAHAWPELYFDGIGWLRFEPTPATRTGAVGDVVTNGTADARSLPTGPSASAPVPTSSANSKLSKENAADSSSAGSAARQSLWHRVLTVVPWPWLAVAGVLLLLAATPAAAAALARRARWRRASTRQARAEAALEELSERLSDLGVRVAPSLTPRGLRQWLVGAEFVPPSQVDALDRLVAEVEVARYAPPAGAGRDADDLREDVREAAAVVADQMPGRRRRLAKIMPATGIAVLTGAARNADSAAGNATRRVADQVGSEVRKLVGSDRDR
jgi:transglutaminase-like putative cysteine protease